MQLVTFSDMPTYLVKGIYAYSYQGTICMHSLRMVELQQCAQANTTITQSLNRQGQQQATRRFEHGSGRNVTSRAVLITITEESGKWGQEPRLFNSFNSLWAND